VASGCINPSFQTCETLGGTVEGCASEAQLCVRTLSDILSSGCATFGSETACLCGTVDPFTCQSGGAPPDGPVAADYICDLGSSISDINANFTNSQRGAGLANSILQCLTFAGCDCF